MKAIVQLDSGAEFDVLNPLEYTLDVRDVAHGLSNTCRFSGQCRDFYSVAEHSVWVSRLVQLVAPEFALHALFHDATEMFLGDLPTPIKAAMPAYQALENRLSADLLTLLGVTQRGQSVVKEADLILLAIEREVQMPPGRLWTALEGVVVPDTLPFTIDAMAPNFAYSLFMSEYDKLRGEG